MENKKIRKSWTQFKEAVENFWKGFTEVVVKIFQEILGKDGKRLKRNFKKLSKKPEDLKKLSEKCWGKNVGN